MTKIKGKEVRLLLGTGDSVNKTIAGSKSLSVRLTTKFDEDRDKDVPDGPYRVALWVEMSGTLSGKLRTPSTNQLSLADLETICMTGKLSGLDVKAALKLSSTVVAKVDKVLFSNLQQANPVSENGTWSVSFKGYSKVYND